MDWQKPRSSVSYALVCELQGRFVPLFFLVNLFSLNWKGISHDYPRAQQWWDVFILMFVVPVQ